MSTGPEVETRRRELLEEIDRIRLSLLQLKEEKQKIDEKLKGGSIG